MREHTDFKSDNKEFGPIGEEKLFTILSNSPKTISVENLSGDKDFFVFDVDLIQFKSQDFNKLNALNLLRLNKSVPEDKATLYEVKTDTVGLTSRNIAYEDISNNGNPGCAAKTMAHYIFYVFIDETTKTIKEQFLINVKHLRTWLKESIPLALNNYHTQQQIIKAKHMKRGNDDTLIYLINVDSLLQTNPNVIRKIT